MKSITPVAHTRPNPIFSQKRVLPSDLDRFKNSSDNTFIENLIEYSGRLCYHSTAKMGKAPNFIAARVREGHEDIIEHASATVHVIDKDPNSGPPITDHLVWRNLNRHCESSYTGGKGYFVTANLRVWLDFFRRGFLLEAIPYLRSIAPKVFAEFDSEEKRKARAEALGRMGGPNPFVGVDPDPEEVELRQANEGPRFGIEPHEIRDSRVTLLSYTQPEPSAPYIHSSATFLIEGVSRAFTHQLVRHRLGSFSQASQRYIELDKGEWKPVLPPSIEDTEAERILEDAWQTIEDAYRKMRKMGIRKEDARFLLPNACETRIVVTMNFEAWSHFAWLRAVDKAAQWEIRRVGQAILEDLYFIAPAFFAEHWEKYHEDRHVGHHANVT